MGHSIYGPDKIGSVAIAGVSAVNLGASTITIGGLQYDTSLLSCDLTINGFGGLDVGSLAIFEKYYLYAVLSGGSVGLVASLSAGAPSGFIAYKKVGLFRTDGSSNIFSKTNYNETGIISQYYFADLDVSFNIASVVDSDGDGLFTVVDNLVANSVSITALEDISLTLGGEARSVGSRAFVAIFDGTNIKVATVDNNGGTNPSESVFPKIRLPQGQTARVEYTISGSLSEARFVAYAKSVSELNWD